MGIFFFFFFLGFKGREGEKTVCSCEAALTENDEEQSDEEGEI